MKNNKCSCYCHKDKGACGCPDWNRCCDNGNFGEKHDCQKQTDRKTHRYPIFRDFDQREVVGWIELQEDTPFSYQDILTPEIMIAENSLRSDFDPERAPYLTSFGLINGKNMLKNPEKNMENWIS